MGGLTELTYLKPGTYSVLYLLKRTYRPDALVKYYERVVIEGWGSWGNWGRFDKE